MALAELMSARSPPRSWGIGNGNAMDTVNLGTEGAYTYSYIDSAGGIDLLTGAGGFPRGAGR